MHNKSITSYLSATGKVRYTLTNDYMFHVVLEQNRNILKGLLCALLHLQPEEITDIVIKNPITRGESREDKEFILDIKLIINSNTLINLELQVINEHNWPERSLGYLCHTFDQLEPGQEYTDALPAIHIGILDFQPFEDNPEFYATYKLLNTKNYHLYSDKFVIHVLDCTHINLATDEDKAHEIDKWAKLFKATTWEELKMAAADNKTMNETLQVLYEYNADDYIRDQCRAREERLRKDRHHQEVIEKLALAQETIAERDSTITEKDYIIATKDSTISKISVEIARLQALLAEKK